MNFYDHELIQSYIGIDLSNQIIQITCTNKISKQVDEKFEVSKINIPLSNILL